MEQAAIACRRRRAAAWRRHGDQSRGLKRCGPQFFIVRKKKESVGNRLFFLSHPYFESWQIKFGKKKQGTLGDV